MSAQETNAKQTPAHHRARLRTRLDLRLLWNLSITEEIALRTPLVIKGDLALPRSPRWTFRAKAVRLSVCSVQRGDNSARLNPAFGPGTAFERTVPWDFWNLFYSLAGLQPHHWAVTVPSVSSSRPIVHQVSASQLLSGREGSGVCQTFRPERC